MSLRRAATAAGCALAGVLAACGAAPPARTDAVLPPGLEDRLAAAGAGKGDLVAAEVRLALASPEERHRVQALAYARGHALPGAEAALAETARGVHRLESRFAIDALIRARTPEARRLLAALPTIPELDVRRLVSRHLAEASDASVEDALLGRLSDSDPETRQIAAQGLIVRRASRPAALLPRLRQLLRTGSGAWRVAALAVLSGYPVGVVRADVERALLEGPDVLAGPAEAALVRWGGNERLASELVPGHPARARAARVLARSGLRAALLPYLDDPDPSVRLAAHYGRESSTPPARLLLLAVVDTLRADRLGAYGYAEGASPHLDRLARRGTLHAEARTQAPWTLASHAALFTSRYASELGVRDVGDALPGSAETLAEILQAKAWATAAVTSIPYLTAAFGMDQGFDWLESETNQRAATVTDRALPLLRGLKGICGSRPPAGLFLFVHYFDPHSNYEPPARWLSTLDPTFSGRYDPMKWDGLSEQELRHLIVAYDGEVAHVDEEIARLLAWMDRLGFHDRDVWVTSDHGEELQDHGKWGHGWRLYEEQARVPLISMLHGVPPGLSLRSARLVDILPTVIARLGIQAPPALRGVSLELGAPARPTYTESQFKGTDLAALVDGDLKVVQSEVVGELFDLAADPSENCDLSAGRPADHAAARERLARETPDALSLVQTPASVSPEMIESLRALGYLGP